MSIVKRISAWEVNSYPIEVCHHHGLIINAIGTDHLGYGGTFWHVFMCVCVRE